MTWATPSTRSDGDAVTAAIWNVQVVNSRNITYNQIQYGDASCTGNIAIGAGNNLSFQSETTVYDGYRDGVNLDRLYAVKTGMHLFAALLSFSGATTLTLKKNGASLATIGSYSYYYDSFLIYLEEDDYITVSSSAGVTMAYGSGMTIKLLTGGWDDYDYWGVV